MKLIHWPYKILYLIALVSIGNIVLTAVYHLNFGGFADEPCTVVHEKDCIRNETHSRAISGARIQAFLNTERFNFRGGGCLNESSRTDTLEIATYGAKIVLERKDDILLVNGVALEKGAKFKSTNVYYLDPWIVSQVEFENLGLVYECRSALPYRRLVVMGTDSLLFSFHKGMTLLTILIAGMIFVSWMLKVKFLSAIPTISIAYLLFLPFMLKFLLPYRRLAGFILLFSFFAFVFYGIVSVFVYRKNVKAFWVMILSLLISGLGALAVGIFAVSAQYQIVQKVLCIIIGIYFIFGSYNLYRYKPRAGNEQKTETP